jgi:hypothetical protein
MVSEQALQRFKELYKKHFSIDLSDQQTTETATNFLALFQLVYKDSIPADDAGDGQPVVNRDFSAARCDSNNISHVRHSEN